MHIFVILLFIALLGVRLKTPPAVIPACAFFASAVADFWRGSNHVFNVFYLLLLQNLSYETNSFADSSLCLNFIANICLFHSLYYNDNAKKCT